MTLHKVEVGLGRQDRAIEPLGVRFRWRVGGSDKRGRGPVAFGGFLFGGKRENQIIFLMDFDEWV